MNDQSERPHLQLIKVPHREIAPSKNQPRTHFAPEKMAELKASLEANGFESISYLLVRPFEYRWMPAHDPRNGMVFEVRTHETSPWQRVRVRFDIPHAHDEGAPAWAKLENEDDIQAALKELPKYEIVDGERRWRNSAELIAEGKLSEELPAVIEAMSDARALELQLLNVLQREGLTPMEEAEGIVRLLGMRTEAGEALYSRATLAAKLGCSERHIGNYVKIGRLRGTAVGEALEAGKLTEKHARILAGVPAGRTRDELTKRVLAPGGPMPTALLERTIRDEFQVELRGADFDTEDPNLVILTIDDATGERIRGGACGDCPFNSKNEEGRELKPGTPQMCRNPECFRLKTAAAHECWMTDVNERAGRPDAALSIEDAAAVFDYSGRKLAFNSGYVELDAAPDESELKSADGVKVQAPGNWRKLIKDQGVPVFYAKDSAGKVHEIAKRDLAKKAAHLNGHLIFKDSAQQERLDEEKSATVGSDQGLAISDQHEEETLEKKAERERAQALHLAELTAIVEAAEGSVRHHHVILPKPFWESVALSLAYAAHEMGVLQPCLARRGWSTETLTQEVGKQTLAQRLGLVVELLAAVSDDSGEGSSFPIWAKVFSVDLKAVRKKVPKIKAKENAEGPTPNVQRATEEKKAA